MRLRPTFDRSMCGLTTGRASQAWHFVRRDIVKHKTKALVNKRCFEDEFSERFLNEESGTEESYDSDTSYESDDSCEDSLHVLPFQLSNKGWVTPGSLEHIKLDNELKNRKPSPLPPLSEEISIQLCLESEIAMTRTNSAISSPMLLSPNLTSSNKPKINDEEESKSIAEKLYNSFETPLDIVTEPDNKKHKPNLLEVKNSLMDFELFDYFSDRPAHVRRIKRLKRRRTVSKKFQELKRDLKVKRDSRTSVYDGLCKLVTIINRKKGKYIDTNMKNSTLFDTQGKVWRNKDLPSFLNLNTDKYLDVKSGFRQKKQNVDVFVTEATIVPPATTLVRKKPKTPSISESRPQETPFPAPAVALEETKENTTNESRVETEFTNVQPQVKAKLSLMTIDSLTPVKEDKPPAVPSPSLSTKSSSPSTKSSSPSTKSSSASTKSTSASTKSTSASTSVVTKEVTSSTKKQGMIK